MHNIFYHNKVCQNHSSNLSKIYINKVFEANKEYSLTLSPCSIYVFSFAIIISGNVNNNSMYFGTIATGTSSDKTSAIFDICRKTSNILLSINNCDLTIETKDWMFGTIRQI